MRPALPNHPAPRSFYDDIGATIAALIARSGLVKTHALIMQVYQDICGESLTFLPDAPPSRRSRLNHDGTPIQFAVTLGVGGEALQFLSEAGAPSLGGLARMRANNRCLVKAARRLNMEGELAAVSALLAAMAPESEPDLLADEGGAFWIGAAFSTHFSPQLRIYINDRWGREDSRWLRLNQFAAFFNSAGWLKISDSLEPELQPLGMSITLSRGSFPSGRIYLSAYGKLMLLYEGLAEAYGSAGFRSTVRNFGRCVLGENYVFPTQNAVCSFGFGGTQELDYKFELCAHCMFSCDAEAASRLRSWFIAADLDASAYEGWINALSAGSLSNQAVDLHCYAGVGLRQGAPYSTIYLKPRWMAA